jgi:hypothetical protein
MCWARPMLEPGGLAERTVREQDLKRISTALHDLCQPLTTMQCRLEMAVMMNTPEDYQDAVVTVLNQCARMTASVSSMRQALRAAQEAEEEIGAAG